MKHLRSSLVLLLGHCLASAPAQYTAEILPTPNNAGWALGAGGGQIVGQGFDSGGGPLLWEGPLYKDYVNLHPAGFERSEVFDVNGARQVGYGRADGVDHALVWSGAAEKYVDLHPTTGFALASQAWATDGVSQVGVGVPFFGGDHALLWSGTAESVVDLHPNGYQYSGAYGVWGDAQVGNLEGRIPAMWRGTAESMVLLPLPKGVNGGFAYAIHGDQIVGTAEGATLWDRDTLEITLLGGGIALDTNGRQQIGYGGGIGEERAIVWAGTPESALDLHQFLPGNFRESRAYGIDENGTIVGWAVSDDIYPIVWTPVRQSRAIAPTSYSMFRGSVISGNLASLQNSDDNRLVMRPGAVFSNAEPPIQIILNATAPTSSPNWFSFSLESNASIANAEQKISLYNYVAGSYEVLDTRLATTSDDTVIVNVTSNPSRFIQPVTMAIRARVGYRALGSTFVYPWLGRIDRAWWAFPG